MKRSLQAFMDGIIDYAGLFPPSELPLEEAIRNYLDYRKGQDAWMLSRFIIPTYRLEELVPYVDLFNSEMPLACSVLGAGTETVSEYYEAIREVVDHCESFCSTHGGRVSTEVLEMKLPKEAAFSDDKELLMSIMADTADVLKGSPFSPSQIFYEGFFDESWENDIQSIIQAIAGHNEGLNVSTGNYRYAAFKMRCGGMEPEHFPSLRQLAFVLHAARKFSVALKGTAGLHHPVRHYAESVQTKMHGFFNVFGAAMLGYTNDLTAEEMIPILGEEDAEQFVFSDEAFMWKDYRVSVNEIKDLRTAALPSYGSCSFDEPREDLKTLSLW